MTVKKQDEKRVVGTIKQIEGDIITVVYQGPNGKNCEIDTTRDKIKTDHLNVGEAVTIDLSSFTSEMKIPLDGSMLEIEDAIKNALGEMKDEIFGNIQPKKKTSAKRIKKA
jgi:hypothetical protein